MPLVFACLFYLLPLNTHQLKSFHVQTQVLLRQESLEKVVSKRCSDIGSDYMYHTLTGLVQSFRLVSFCFDNTSGSKGKKADLCYLV